MKSRFGVSWWMCGLCVVTGIGAIVVVMMIFDVLTGDYYKGRAEAEERAKSLEKVREDFRKIFDKEEEERNRRLKELDAATTQQLKEIEAEASQARRAAELRYKQAISENEIKLARARQELAELDRREVELAAAQLASAVEVNREYRGRDTVKTDFSEPSGWRYPTDYEARELAKKTASMKWGNDSKSVSDELTDQMEAYKKLAKHEGRRWSNPAIRRILNQAGSSHGADFVKILDEVETQLRANGLYSR